LAQKEREKKEYVLGTANITLCYSIHTGYEMVRVKSLFPILI